MQLGVDARSSYEVERQDRLVEEAIPEVEREVRVNAAEAGDEVILEGANGAFRGIAAMDPRGGQLEVDVGIMEEALQNSGGFIV